MYLVYFITKNGDRHWKMATTKESIDEYVKENNIEDYSITVNDVEYEKMKNKIEWLEHRIEDIKRTLKDIEERY